MTIVELDRLVATFSITATYVKKLKVGEQLTIRFPESQQQATGTIDFISPIIDAESGTIRVKIQVDNSDNRYRSGERCVVQIQEN